MCPSQLPPITLVCSVVVVCVLCYVLCAMQELKRFLFYGRVTYCRGMGWTVDSGMPAAYFVAFALRAAAEAHQPDSIEGLRFYMAGWYLELHQLWIAVAMFGCGIRFIRYLSGMPRITYISRTFTTSVGDLVAFLGVGAVLFCTFALLFHHFFGESIEDFRSFHISMFSVLR